MPNDVSVICNKKNQRRQEKASWTTKGMKMSKGEKKTTQ
jgi:hypothetical protein